MSWLETPGVRVSDGYLADIGFGLADPAGPSNGFISKNGQIWNCCIGLDFRATIRPWHGGC